MMNCHPARDPVAYFLPFRQTGNEPALHHHHHHDRRQQRQHGRCHHRTPVGLCLHPDHLDDANHDRIESRIGGDQQRPQVLVPAIDEQDDEQRRDVGGRHRDQDVAQETQRAGAVHAGGLHQFVGDRHEHLAEQQRRGGRGNQRHGETGEAVDQAEVGHHRIGRDDPHLDRQHQGNEDQPECSAAEREAEEDHRIGRQYRNDDLAHRDRERHAARDEQHVPHRLGTHRAFGQYARIDAKSAEVRQQRKLAAGDRAGILRGSRQHQPHGQGEQQHADAEYGMRQPVGSLRGHGVIGTRSGEHHLAHALVRRPMKRNWIAVSAITPTISTTDCADDEPRSRFTTPSRYTLITSVSVSLPGPPCVSA